MSNPWMKFYPRDWRGDQSLRAVSVAARGLWIECLCIMHEAKPYGHLVLNGNPVEDDTLARMTGVSVDEVSALMAELRQAGVLSVTGKGVVFSRRMTKDHARAGKGRKAVQKRWAQQPDKQEKPGEPNRSPIRTPTTQKPEARSQIEEEPDGSLSETGVPDPPKPSRRRKTYPEQFERAWAAYPTDANMSKLDAFKAWSKLDAEDHAKVDAAIPGFVAYCRKNTDYRPVHMQRFITSRRFDGFADSVTHEHAPDVWAKRLAYARKNKRWATGQWGPMPGGEGCQVPTHMLEPQDGAGWAHWDAQT